MEKPRNGVGLRWETGGWFGGQIGGTLWMLISALVVWSTDASVALLLLACFAIPNVLATGIWMRRDRWRSLTALLVLFALIGAFSLAATVVLDRAGSFATLGYGGTTTSGTMYFMIALLTPGLMLMIYFQDRSLRKRGSDQPD